MKKIFLLANFFTSSLIAMNGEEIPSPAQLLCHAAQSDQHIAVTTLLLHCGMPADSHDPTLTSPLFQAAWHCQPRTLATLLEHNANPNHEMYQKTAPRLTPLHAVCRSNLDSFNAAANNNRRSAIEWLLAANANTNARDRQGKTPLFDLITTYRDEKCPILFSPRKKLLFFNARKTLIDLLMLCKADPTLKDSRGESALCGHSQERCGLLSIYTAIKFKARRAQLRELLFTYLSKARAKRDATSDFKNMPNDILQLILKLAYP